MMPKNMFHVYHKAQGAVSVVHRSVEPFTGPRPAGCGGCEGASLLYFGAPEDDCAYSFLVSWRLPGVVLLLVISVRALPGGKRCGDLRDLRS